MANTIDTSTISGFDAMTAEQKVEALLGVEIPDPVDLEQYVSKEIYNKKSTEAANLSKALKEKETALKSKQTEQMTETERMQAQIQEIQEASEEALRAMREENEALKRKDTLRDYQTNFGLLGFDEKLAGETANALADGDSAKVFTNLRKFLDAYKKTIEAELMSHTPKPDGAGSSEQGKEDPAMAYIRKRAAARAEIAKQAEEARKQFMN